MHEERKGATPWDAAVSVSYTHLVLSESTGHNIYDLENDFKPEEAQKVELS